MSEVVAAAITLLLLGSVTAHSADRCRYDEQALLALDENAFDQDWVGTGGGWRTIASIPGCELAAAELLAAYQAKHPYSNSILAWHEGQMRASANQYERAIPLLESARKPADQDDAGWNFYVDATVAFLRHDKSKLLEARRLLASVAFPENSGYPALKDGIVEMPARPGKPSMKFRWPINIDTVDGLVACFDKPYSEAYAVSCRPAPP